MDTPFLNEIMKKIKVLPDNMQRQVLIFVDALRISSLRGKSGLLLLQFARTIPLDDLTIMSKTIESGCEKFHKGISSRKTCARMRARYPFSVTTSTSVPNKFYKS